MTKVIRLLIAVAALLVTAFFLSGDAFGEPQTEPAMRAAIEQPSYIEKVVYLEPVVIVYTPEGETLYFYSWEDAYDAGYAYVH